MSQFVYTLIGFHWVAYTAVEFGHLPVPLGVLALLGFAAIAHLYLPIAGTLEFFLNRLWPAQTIVRLFRFVILISLGENIFPTIFPWNHGYPWLYVNMPIYQWADVIGMQGLSTLVLLFNLFFFSAFHAYRQKLSSKIWARPLILFGAIFSILNLTGYWKALPYRNTDSELKVLIVQANIGNFEKYLAERVADVRGPIVEKYLALTETALKDAGKPDLVMWPETAFPDYFDEPYIYRGYQAQVLNFFKDRDITLLSGGYSQNLETRRVYNGLFLFDPPGLSRQSYRKTILLAFGEYFPGAKYFPFLKKLVPAISDFDSGSGATVFNMNLTPAEKVSFGLQICYEGLFPWFSNELSQKGAQLLTNVTNDSWYGVHYQPWQHMYMTLSRAIETRRPLIRSTNTGISTAILADGSILQQSPLAQEWFGHYKVKYLKNPPHTIFERFGFLLTYLYILLLALTILKTNYAKK